MSDLYKHCRICQKILTINDAFGSPDPDLCEFCSKHKELQIPIGEPKYRCTCIEPIPMNIIARIKEDQNVNTDQA